MLRAIRFPLSRLFFQAKQPHLLQSLLIRLVLQPFHQLCCPLETAKALSLISMTKIWLYTYTVIYKVIGMGCFLFTFHLLSWCSFLVYSFVLVKVSSQSGNFATYSTIYELPTGERWASELWLSHWRRRIWDVRKGGKVPFRGFCSAGTQGSKWGTGDSSHFSHAQTPTASDLCWLSVLGWWRTNDWAREKAVQDVSYLQSPFLCHDNRLPHKLFLHAHTVFRYFTNNWLAEVNTYNYLTGEKEKLIETHPRLHT